MNQKYELLQNDTKTVLGITLFRIKAKISFGSVVKGDLGGYIEKENCLDISGDAWVYGNAWVFGDARVYGDAQVFGNAQVYGNAQVSGNARVFGDAILLSGFIKLSLDNISFSLMAQLGVCLIKEKCILYKRVNKISNGKYSSCYDKNFIYEDNKIAKVENPDLSEKSCSTGIHLSSALYWQDGDTLIACEVKKDDIITVQSGKVRVKQCKVIGEVKI